MTKIHTILGPALEAAKDCLKSEIGLTDSSELLQKFHQVREIREIDQNSNQVLADNGISIEKIDDSSEAYRITVDKQKGLINKLRNELQAHKISGEDYLSGEDVTESGSSSEDKDIQSNLANITNILKRSYGRRTGMFSWVLYGVLRYLGFKEDNFEPIEKLLNSPDFIKQFITYQKCKNANGAADANQSLDSVFEGEEKEQKQKLLKLASFAYRACSSLPKWAVEVLPVAYAIQNLAMPILARVVKTGILGRFFDFMRTVNPWIGEFFAEPLGIFKPEIVAVRETATRELNPSSGTGASEQNQVTDSISVSSLNAAEYNLQKVVRKVNAALERLFGRKSNVSSLIFNLILKFGRSKDYQQYARQFVDNPGFIKKLYALISNQEHKSETANSPDPQVQVEKKDKWENHDEAIVGSVVSGAVSISKTMPKWFIDKAPKYFGLPYSFQYLLMPIIAKFVNPDSKLGKLLGIIRDVNPILSDLVFDPVATFQEEIKAIREEKETIALFPDLAELGFRSPLSAVANKLMDLLKLIKNFGKKVAVNISPGTT